jgi:hypothetical protein
MTADLADHITALYDRGLCVVPTWGQGKAPAGRDHRKLGDEPPTLPEALIQDYAGGLAILCGTPAPDGYVTGIDVDGGPEQWGAESRWPKGTLYVEAGTGPGKYHLFVLTKDRLEGVRNLYRQERLVCEVKGYGHALRSWPTVPEGKPHGYTPIHWAPSPWDAHVEAEVLLGGMGHFLQAAERVLRASNGTSGPGAWTLIQEPITAARNSTLASVAGWLRARNMKGDELEAALVAFNDARCVPPLPVREVLEIARSYSRYADSQKRHKGFDDPFREEVA